MLTEPQRAELLAIARAAIGGNLSAPVGGSFAREARTDSVWPRAGAFVTLRHRGALRGCIGHVEADDPLDRTVARVAAAAAWTDPRFPPVAAEELPDIAIEISVLGALEEIAGPEQIEIGRHGLVVQRAFCRGLLLPQVAVEHGWSADVFIAQTCVKAGLPADAWQTGVRLWRFDAEVFGESAPDERA